MADLVGIAEESITGIWWVVRVGKVGVILEQRLRCVRGPFATREAAQNALQALYPPLQPQGDAKP